MSSEFSLTSDTESQAAFIYGMYIAFTSEPADAKKRLEHILDVAETARQWFCEEGGVSFTDTVEMKKRFKELFTGKPAKTGA